MHVIVTSSVASLDSTALARRLGELAGDERRVQADFLLHLEAFDHPRGYLEAGYSSLWDFCLKALHLREGAAGRRIAAMRVLRRFPVLESALREGKLCLSTLGLIGPVLAEANLDEVVDRSAFRTRAEVDRLVASLQARHAPKDGIRKVAGPRHVPEEVTEIGRTLPMAPAKSLLPSPLRFPRLRLRRARSRCRFGRAPNSGRCRRRATRSVSRSTPPSRASSISSGSSSATRCRAGTSPRYCGKRFAAPSRSMGSAAGRWPRGGRWPRRAGRAASRCRRPELPRRLDRANVKASAETPTSAAGAVSGESRPASPGQPSDQRSQARSRPAIPSAVRREVWARDGGQCTWCSNDGRRRQSRWQLEFDHVVPVALGGPTTAANLRLACRAHNTFHAEKVFGREHMARFRREATRQGEFAIAGGGGR